MQALASPGTFAQRSGGHFSTNASETNCAIAVAKAAETSRTLTVPIACGPAPRLMFWEYENLSIACLMMSGEKLGGKARPWQQS